MLAGCNLDVTVLVDQVTTHMCYASVGPGRRRAVRHLTTMAVASVIPNSLKWITNRSVFFVTVLFHSQARCEVDQLYLGVDDFWALRLLHDEFKYLARRDYSRGCANSSGLQWYTAFAYYSKRFWIDTCAKEAKT